METLHRCPLAQILIIVALVNHDIGSVLFAALPICLRAARFQHFVYECRASHACASELFVL